MTGGVSCLAVAWPSFIQKKVFAGANELPVYHLLSIEDETKDIYYLVPLDLSDPFVMAVHLAISLEIPIHFIDTDLRFSIDEYWIRADDYPVARLGIERYYEIFQKNRHGGPETREDDERAAHAMARSLEKLSKEHENVLFICEIFHWETVRLSMEKGPEGAGIPLPASVKPKEPGKRIHLFQVYKNSIKWASVEIPYVLSLFVEHVKRDDPDPFDKWEALRSLLREVRARYKETIYEGEFRNFESYLHKVCEMEGKIFPDLWDLLRASHQVLGEEFTTHLYRLASRYFQQDHEGPHEIIEFNSHFLGDGSEWSSAWKELRIDARPYRSLTRQVLRKSKRRAPLIKSIRKEDEKSYREWMMGLVRWTRKNGEPNRPVHRLRGSKRHPLRIAVIFEDKDRYHFPFRGLDPARNGEEGHLLFYATSPEMEQAFPESEVLAFGGVAMSFGRKPLVNIFSEGGQGSPYMDSLKEAVKDFHVSDGEKLVLALAENQWEAEEQEIRTGNIILVSALPPSENVVELLNRMNITLSYFPIQRVPRTLLRHLRLPFSLGLDRAKRILEKIS